MTRKILSLLAILGLALALHAPTATAQGEPVTGAIFTTDSSGEPVNLNIYEAPEDVYLNGGPGINAPDDAAGLPDGTYYFQVTDPSGKELLSTDDLECRQFIVVGGVIDAVTGPCPHETGLDGEDEGATVQLFPYRETPNNGGVYKVWVTPIGDYDTTAPGNKHGFVPHFSKTDNFKVERGPIVEIDTRFEKNGEFVDGLAAEWTDTLGARNKKWSEYNPRVLAFHEAHVEAAEQGLHRITVKDQTGCTIDHVHTPTGGTLYPQGGEVTVPVRVKSHSAGDATYFVDVHCTE